MVNPTILPAKLKNVTVRKKSKTILDGISCTLEPEGFSIVMGPNGSGKTTLLRLLHGLERPRGGTLDWNVPQTEARAHQSFVFQTPVMMRRSVLDNIAYPLIVRDQPKKTVKEAANNWAVKVGLGQASQMEARFLSGGERQKLALARALISSPEVLFLDEPTTNLDGQSTKEIETILTTAAADGTRMIMSTHNIGQAKRLASEILFLNKGKICEQTEAATFFQSPNSPEAQAYLQGDIVE